MSLIYVAMYNSLLGLWEWKQVRQEDECFDDTSLLIIEYEPSIFTDENPSFWCFVTV